MRYGWTFLLLACGGKDPGSSPDTARADTDTDTDTDADSDTDTDADTDSDADADTDADTDTDTDTGRPPGPDQVLINEVLFDPSLGEEGDANCDGVVDTGDDEFVEVANLSAGPLDLSGAQLTDDAEVRHVFPPGTVLPPGGAVVVFGGGAPRFEGRGPCAPLPVGVLVQVASERSLALTNTYEVLSLLDRKGRLLDRVSWPTQVVSDQSWQRDPELEPGASFIGHRSLTDLPASPGRSWQGGPLTDPGDLPTDTGAPWLPAVPPETTTGPSLVIAEILADPASVDASCDGSVSSSADEFVELVNNGTALVDLSGGSLEDGVLSRHVFPAGTTLSPGETLVVFGGGEAVFDGSGVGEHCAAWPPGRRAQRASSGGLALDNAGDQITVRDSGGRPLAEAAYEERTAPGVSLAPYPEWSREPLEPHTRFEAATGPISPGRTVDGG